MRRSLYDEAGSYFQRRNTLFEKRGGTLNGCVREVGKAPTKHSQVVEADYKLLRPLTLSRT